MNFSTHLHFAKTALNDACNHLQGELFTGETVCIRHLDRQVSQFVMLLVTLTALLGLAGLRSILRL